MNEHVTATVGFIYSQVLATSLFQVIMQFIKLIAYGTVIDICGSLISVSVAFCLILLGEFMLESLC